MRRLPPLNSLRAFEAVGRRLSFTKAAAELNVTPAAMSQQVKALEAHLGVPLIRRSTRSLLLTDAGQRLLQRTTEGLDLLLDGVMAAASRSDGAILTVSVCPSFGAKWLVPRVAEFTRAHPHIDVRVDVTDDLVDLRRERVDIAVRYGRGGYAGTRSQALMDEYMFPVCAPDLLRGHHAIREADDLRHHTLLHIDWKFESDAAPVWSMWLKAAGVSGVDAERGPRFNTEAMGLQEAIAGRGVMLASSVAAADDLAAGRLVRPFTPATRQATTFSYYLVHAEDRTDDPDIRAFADWLGRELARTERFVTDGVQA